MLRRFIEPGLIFMTFSAFTNSVARSDEPDIHYGVPSAPEKARGCVRLATYNAENLFDDVDDPKLSEAQDDVDETKPTEQRRALAEVISSLDVDILCLQEIESRQSLEWFRDEWLADLGYDYIASIDAGDERGIEQSVLSRHPVISMENWPHLELAGRHPDDLSGQHAFRAGTPLHYHRSPLKVRIRVTRPEDREAHETDDEGDGPTTELIVFVVHQKSGRAGEYWRNAEAAMTAHKVGDVLNANPDALVAVVGDFNCASHEDGATPYVGVGLVDLLGEAGADNSLTLVTHASGRRIDHLFASRSLAEVVVGSPFVVGTPTREPGTNWRTTDLPSGYASDHFPVCVDLRLPASARR